MRLMAKIADRKSVDAKSTASSEAIENLFDGPS
jgi:hypothetical protein